MSPIRMSRLESGIRIVLDFNEAFNRHDVPGMVKLISEDCVIETAFPAPDGSLYKGREVLPEYWEGFFHDSQQAHNEIEEIFSFGLRCIMRWRLEWIDGVGKKSHLRGVDIYQVKDSFISEILSYVKR